MVETHYKQLRTVQLSHFLLLATNSHRPPIERENEYTDTDTCIHPNNNNIITVSLHVSCDIMHYNSEIYMGICIHCTCGSGEE